MKAKPPSKPKRGRPPLPPEQMGRPITMYLRARDFALLERLGGTAQGGIRELIRREADRPAN